MDKWPIDSAILISQVAAELAVPKFSSNYRAYLQAPCVSGRASVHIVGRLPRSSGREDLRRNSGFSHFVLRFWQEETAFREEAASPFLAPADSAIPRLPTPLRSAQ